MLKSPLPKLLYKKAQFFIVHYNFKISEIIKNPKKLILITFTLKRMD